MAKGSLHFRTCSGNSPGTTQVLSRRLLGVLSFVFAQKMLGQSREVAAGVQGALQRVRDVHTSDELMHCRIWALFVTLLGALPMAA